MPIRDNMVYPTRSMREGLGRIIWVNNISIEKIKTTRCWLKTEIIPFSAWWIQRAVTTVINATYRIKNISKNFIFFLESSHSDR